MAYDEDLANRIRELLAGEKGVTEKKMFGGLAFLIRVDPADSEALVRKPHCARMVMRGREMDGWLRVAPDGVRTKRQLEPWVKRGVGYARSLPAKG
jgi:hypothetical protein